MFHAQEPGENPPDPRQEVEVARDQLGAAVAELEVAAKDSLRPAAWVRRNPYVWIGGAFVLGLALGWSGGEHAR